MGELFALDPVIARACGALISIVLLTSAWQKLRDPLLFRYTLENYRLLPEALMTPVAFGLPLLEAAAGTAVLFSASRTAGAVLALMILATVSAAVAINLARGRFELDCGCGGISGSQPISRGLIVRNLVLMALAAFGAHEGSARQLVWFDYLTAGFGTLALLGIYVSANQLLANHPRLTALRPHHG